jgi:AcrR family transcriptional regulator
MATKAQTKTRSDDVRLRLLDAAIEVFGRHGFDGASTRMLARSAGVNLQAIPYYFGGKDGLYLAVADHIAERIRAHIGPVAMKVGARLAAMPEGGHLPAAEARLLLVEMLEAAAQLMLSEESAAFARFIVSEQMEPTAAFERLYEKIMGPLLQRARSLVGAILAADPESEMVRLRTIAMMGQILVFRIAHAAVMRQLNWQKIGAREFAAIHGMIPQLVAAIAPAPSTEAAS